MRQSRIWGERVVDRTASDGLPYNAVVRAETSRRWRGWGAVPGRSLRGLRSYKDAGWVPGHGQMRVVALLYWEAPGLDGLAHLRENTLRDPTA